MSCLRLSRISSTPLSLSRAGLSCVRLSLTSPEIWCETTVRLFISASSESRSSSNAASSALEFATRPAICWLRLPSTAETLLAFPNRLRSCASRLLRVSENRATPCSAGLRSGGVSLKVFANVVSAEDNWVVSRPLIVVVRSPSASGRSYGEVVRSSGMVPVNFPSPRVVSSSILAPRIVSVLIAASVRSPRSMPLRTVNPTRTLVPSRRTSETLPTPMPETRTVLPGLMPPASEK